MSRGFRSKAVIMSVATQDGDSAFIGADQGGIQSEVVLTREQNGGGSALLCRWKLSIGVRDCSAAQSVKIGRLRSASQRVRCSAIVQLQDANSMHLTDRLMLAGFVFMCGAA